MTVPPIDCGACHGCCHQVVKLEPGDTGIDWALDEEALAMGLRLLRRHADGSCVYLDPLLSCTIYAQRPQICRTFHCGLWFRKLTADERLGFALGDRADREMLESGRRHAKDAG